MAERSSNSRLLFALATALGAALLVIAFLVGRESMRSAPNDASAAEHRLPPVPHLDPEAQREASAARDPWQERDKEYAYADAHWGSGAGIHQKADGTIVLSNTKNDEESKSDSVDPPTARPKAEKANLNDVVAAYFQQVDVIHSNAGAGDPNAFAMDMIKAGMGGATSGFDRLISDTDRMRREVQRVTPPPSCRGYHEASLEALEESGRMLESLKVAITTRNVQSLGMIAQQSADLQAKAEALTKLQEEIRASAP